jgi:hypothetical protein
VTESLARRCSQVLRYILLHTSCLSIQMTMWMIFGYNSNGDK